MEYQLLYYVVPNDNFIAEDRIFYEGEKYPVYEKSGKSLLIAENGEFIFTHEIMEKAIREWELNVITVTK